MVRLLLLFAIVALAVYWLSRPKGEAHGVRKAQGSWLRAGGVLGLLILLARVFHIPLVGLLRYLPFMMKAFHQAASAQEHPQQEPRSHAGMSAEEARVILGLSERASNEDIAKAHRKLIAQNHPDKGGSDYLAAKINEARDVLLKK